MRVSVGPRRSQSSILKRRTTNYFYQPYRDRSHIRKNTDSVLVIEVGHVVGLLKIHPRAINSRDVTGGKMPPMLSTPCKALRVIARPIMRIDGQYPFERSSAKRCETLRGKLQKSVATCEECHFFLVPLLNSPLGPWSFAALSVFTSSFGFGGRAGSWIGRQDPNWLGSLCSKCALAPARPPVRCGSSGGQPVGGNFGIRLRRPRNRRQRPFRRRVWTNVSSCGLKTNRTHSPPAAASVPNPRESP